MVQSAGISPGAFNNTDRFHFPHHVSIISKRQDPLAVKVGYNHQIIRYKNCFQNFDNIEMRTCYGRLTVYKHALSNIKQLAIFLNYFTRLPSNPKALYSAPEKTL